MTACNGAELAAVFSVVVGITQTGGCLVLIPIFAFPMSGTDPRYTSFKQPRAGYGAIGSSPVNLALALRSNGLTIEAATFAAGSKIAVLTNRTVLSCEKSVRRIVEASTFSIQGVTKPIITARLFSATITHDVACYSGPSTHATAQARRRRAVSSTTANKIRVASRCGTLHGAVCCGVAFDAGASSFTACTTVGACRALVCPRTLFTAILFRPSGHTCTDPSPFLALIAHTMT